MLGSSASWSGRRKPLAPSRHRMGDPKAGAERERINGKIAEPCVTAWRPKLRHLDGSGEHEKGNGFRQMSRGISEPERETDEQKSDNMLDVMGKRRRHPIIG